MEAIKKKFYQAYRESDFYIHPGTKAPMLEVRNVFFAATLPVFFGKSGGYDYDRPWGLADFLRGENYTRGFDECVEGLIVNRTSVSSALFFEGLNTVYSQMLIRGDKLVYSAVMINSDIISWRHEHDLHSIIYNQMLSILEEHHERLESSPINYFIGSLIVKEEQFGLVEEMKRGF